MSKLAHSSDYMETIERQGRAHAEAEPDISAQYVGRSMAHFDAVMGNAEPAVIRRMREERAEIRNRIQSGHREWSCHTPPEGRE